MCLSHVSQELDVLAAQLNDLATGGMAPAGGSRGAINNNHDHVPVPAPPLVPLPTTHAPPPPPPPVEEDDSEEDEAPPAHDGTLLASEPARPL